MLGHSACFRTRNGTVVTLKCLLSRSREVCDGQIQQKYRIQILGKQIAILGGRIQIFEHELAVGFVQEHH